MDEPGGVHGHEVQPTFGCLSRDASTSFVVPVESCQGHTWVFWSDFEVAPRSGAIPRDSACEASSVLWRRALVAASTRSAAGTSAARGVPRYVVGCHSEDWGERACVGQLPSWQAYSNNGSAFHCIGRSA